MLPAGLAVLLRVPLVRTFFEMSALPMFDVAAIVSVALLWALLLRFLWRFRLLERLLGKGSQEGPSSQAVEQRGARPGEATKEREGYSLSWWWRIQSSLLSA